MKAIALMGATGSGKSALAMRWAQQDGSCIICCDSMQLYQGLDIGTAKPSREERAQVVHHLVDCCQLPDHYSAARWAEEARQVIRRANAEGITPLIVGGTGLYLKALTVGFADIPAEQPAVRAELEKLLQQQGAPALYARLQACDPATAAQLHAGDRQRVMRALSVYESSGVPLSIWQRRASDIPPIDCPVLVLEKPRDQLRQDLATRFHAMLDAGWLDEVAWLIDQSLSESHPAMRAVGYRQLREALQGECSMTQAIDAGITATRRYAKRQVTWFNHQTPDALHGDAATLEAAYHKLRAAMHHNQPSKERHLA